MDDILDPKKVKDARERYLPAPCKTGDKVKDEERYNAYHYGALCYPITQRTLAGMVGEVCKKEGNQVIPDSLNPIVEDANGTGSKLTQQAKKSLSLVLSKTRAGLYVDYPKVEDGQVATVADLAEGKIRPVIHLYPPEAIINWRTYVIGGQKRLSLVVLAETKDGEDDGFDCEKIETRRELRMVDGVFTIQLWEKAGSDFKKEGGLIVPTDYQGNPFDEIPFQFIGGEANDCDVEPPILEPLANINYSHYLDSAAWQDSVAVMQPTLGLIGVNEEWLDTLKRHNKGEVKMGVRSGVWLPVGGDIKIVQPDPNTLAKESMEMKERQAVAVGAKLIEQKTVQRTATEAGIENSAEVSVLAAAAMNVGQAWTKALQWAGLMVGELGEIIFEMNTDFDSNMASPQERQQLLSEWQAGGIAFPEYRAGLRKAGIATIEDDDEARELIEQETGLEGEGIDGGKEENPEDITKENE